MDASNARIGFSFSHVRRREWEMPSCIDEGAQAATMNRIAAARSSQVLQNRLLGRRRPRLTFESRHQARVASRGGGVDAGHSLSREPCDIVRTACLGAGAAE